MNISVVKSKKYIITSVCIMAALLFAGVLIMQNNKLITTKNVKRDTPLVRCVQPKQGTVIASQSDKQNIDNAVVTSITDVPAGTNVKINLSAYNNKQAKGTSNYGSHYGTYNFTVKKSDNDASPYTNGWEVTDVEACRP